MQIFASHKTFSAKTFSAISARKPMARPQSQADSLHFSGNRTMKLPRYVQKQIDFLKDKLGLPAADIVSLASGLMPAASYFPSSRKIPTFMMVAPGDLAALKLEERYPSENPTEDRQFSTAMTETDFQTWQKGKAAILTPKQTFLQKLREWVPIKSEVSFEDRAFRDTAEGAYNFVFSLIPVFTPFGIINYLRVKRHDTTRVLKGINLLMEATQRKLKSPGEVLLSYTVSPQLDPDYKPLDSPIKVFSLTQHNKAFAGFKSA